MRQHNLNDSSEEEQIKAVSVNPYYNIRFIDNPSERVQLVAVKTIGYLIEYIKNPTKDVLITALLKILNDGNIKFVEKLMKKYSHRNYPEFAIIRQSIENDK